MIEIFISCCWCPGFIIRTESWSLYPGLDWNCRCADEKTQSVAQAKDEEEGVAARDSTYCSCYPPATRSVSSPKMGHQLGIGLKDIDGGDESGGATQNNALNADALG